MSELRKMTRMGGDLRKIARLLQNKGRNGDTILAHINPREAALLREQGGSGAINPETGLPEFFDVPEGYDEEGLDNLISNVDSQSYSGYESVPEGLFEGAAYSPETSGYELGRASLNTQVGAPEFTTGLERARAAELGPIPTTSQFNLTGRPRSFDPSLAGSEQQGQQAEKGFLDSLSGGDKLRLGLGLAGGVQTAMAARKARQGSQQGADQIRQLGRPYQERGLAEQSAASRGELNPVGQQQLDAMRARAAQAGVNRGGVGVAQQQRAEEDLRQRLLAAQQDFGLKLSGIGDQYTMKAIQEGIRADQEISNMYANYFGNLARLAAPTVIQSTQSAGK
jgi:hypothetical protein